MEPSPTSAGGCPAVQELSAFYLGKLPPDNLRAVADHLDSPGCQSGLGALEGQEDELVNGLRQAPPAEPFSEEVECRQVLQRLRTLAPEALPPSLGRSSPGQGEEAPLWQLGQYQLLARLGRGGMGTVYRALHPRLKRVVALKVLSARGVSAGAVARFQREMEAVGKLDHPHIVRASDAGEVDGTHFLVMEFVDGLDLSRLVKACGPLAVADACELVRQAALGLAHAHEHGLVHRDVKPSNLMLDARGQVKVLDLGLALLQREQPAEDDLTAAGQVLGTFDYMAPEQGDDTHSVDIRADLYSLGCTLYHLLAGHPPFGGPQYRTFRSKLWAHAHAPVPPILDRQPPLPPGLSAVLDRLLAKEPAARCATPAEVADALAPFTPGHDLPGLLARARLLEEAKGRQPEALLDTDDPLASALAGTRSSQEKPGEAAQPARQAPAAAPVAGPRRTRRRTALLGAALLILFGSLAVSQVLTVPRTGPEVPDVREGRAGGPRSAAEPPPNPKVASRVLAARGQGEEVAADKAPMVYATALFAFEERGSGARDLGAKVADLLAARLGARPDLVLVDRQEMNRTLGEAELSLSGMVRPAEATRVGQLTGARLLVCGSVIPVDKRLYLVARVIGTETGRLQVVSVDGRASDELAPLAEKLADRVGEAITKQGDRLVARPARRKDRLKALAGKLEGAKRPAVLVQVGERHVGAAPADPAAQTELTRWLRGAGFEVIDPEEGVRGKADVLLLGEAVSEPGHRRGGLVSVKGRVEVRAVERKGGRVLAAERQVSLVVDLSEQLAGKAALQRAAADLAERLLPKLIVTPARK